MRNILAIVFVMFLSLIGLSVYSDDTTIESEQSIRQGTFIKVMVPVEISTLESDIGDEVWFLNTQDMYIYETNAIPKNSKIYGIVEDVREPVRGRDGAIKIIINKIITPDKKIYNCLGHIYTDNDNYIGGAETISTYYRKVPHYNFRIRPYLQVAPMKVYEIGRHTVIKPGSEYFVILEEDVQLK